MISNIYICKKCSYTVHCTEERWLLNLVLSKLHHEFLNQSARWKFDRFCRWKIRVLPVPLITGRFSLNTVRSEWQLSRFFWIAKNRTANETICSIIKYVFNRPPLYVVSLQAPAKRSRHFNKTYRNIVWRNMLRAFGHPVATCCDMLRHVGCCWLKF